MPDLMITPEEWLTVNNKKNTEFLESLNMSNDEF